MAGVRGTDQEDAGRGVDYVADIAVCRYAGWFVDGKRHRAHADILWCAGDVAAV